MLQRHPTQNTQSTRGCAGLTQHLEIKRNRQFNKSRTYKVLILRAVASLLLPVGQEMNISSIFPYFPVVSLIFPQFFFYFLPHFGLPGRRKALTTPLLILSILLHGAETWTLKKVDANRLQTFKLMCLYARSKESPEWMKSETPQ